MSDFLSSATPAAGLFFVTNASVSGTSTVGGDSSDNTEFPGLLSNVDINNKLNTATVQSMNSSTTFSVIQFSNATYTESDNTLTTSVAANINLATSASSITKTSASTTSSVLSPAASTNVVLGASFLLHRGGSDDFLQWGPEGSIILGPAPPVNFRARSLPASFSIHKHGYLTNGDDPTEIVFLRLANISQSSNQTDTSNLSYYSVIHGPKSDVSTQDLTAQFSLEEGLLGYVRQGFNGSSISTTNSPITSEVTSSTLASGCSEIPDPTVIWQLLHSISKYRLHDYCSTLLGYDIPVTTTRVSANATAVFTMTITTFNSTETEISTTYVETSTVAASTVYDANNDDREAESTKAGAINERQDNKTGEIEYEEIEAEEIQAEEIQAGEFQVAEETQDIEEAQEAGKTQAADGNQDNPFIVSTISSATSIPSEIAIFCPVAVSAACSQAFSYPQPLYTVFNETLKKVTVTFLTALVNTTTETLSTVTTTTLPKTTEITYPGTGRLVTDSGTYHLWYLYWTNQITDPALYLRLASSTATTFTAEYRPNIDTYRLYTTAPDGQKYYMSINIPVGMVSITDYSIGLRTLNDINSDENFSLLYVNYNWDSEYVSVNVDVMETDRNTMFGCPMLVGGEMRSQVRLYAVGDGTVPRDCQAWSNLMFAP
ncbi:hypothetical protein ABW20_dc0106737 [Dactylellina cionopaga]|nr:hypothetical protein ABW20_dc0106737 [Dactylellina cionopaga]